MTLLFDHLERPIITPQPHYVRYVVARPSACRLSVCNARAPYSERRVHDRQEVEIFGNISMAFGTLAIR